jgi:hypothetical protein
VQAGRFLDAFGSDVAGDATAQRDPGVCLEPDAVFPAVVVLRRNAKTESTIKIASGGALIFVSRWSSPVNGSCPHSATMPEPPGPAGDSSRSRAEPKS